MMLPRLAVIGDFVEEKWPSMDLVAEMLFQHLEQEHAGTLTATFIRPQMRRRLTRLGVTTCRSTFNADRLFNRWWDYPRRLRKLRDGFELFHVTDHSYAHLLHRLPPERAVVTCHDLDAFRPLFQEDAEPRSRLLKALAARNLEGLQRAARVVCVSEATRQDLLAHHLYSDDRVVVIPNGVHPSFSPEPDPRADKAARCLLGSVEASVDAQNILHVGSSVRRKRVDVLLRVFAAVRLEFPRARLIRVGGPFTAAQKELVERLGLKDSVVVIPFVEREVLAALYRNASVLLQTSEREGFGLPVIEAMACGTPVVASDLPVLREVGGDAALYCPLEDVGAWAATVIGLLNEQREQHHSWSNRGTVAQAQAAKYSWAEHTRRMVALYHELL
ncbi:MAG TPA: glycosyltransferase family 1 protein [Pyrinomonadaceae bacterium]|jgi:glycosyltransferase involved in cell wall biosynthesis|nr:glycosyltransferase family 1 protein [Pyrinomonadaceae bacterium]